MFKQILTVLLCLCVHSWSTQVLANNPPNSGDAGEVEQASVVLGVGRLTNLQPEQRDALITLIEMEMRKWHSEAKRVRLKSQSDEGLRSLAQERGAKVVVTLDGTRIGRRVLLLVRALRNGSIQTESLNLESLDDFPTGIRRALEAIFTEKSYEETAKVTNLTGSEVRIHRKKYGEFFWGVGLEQGTTLTVNSQFNFGASMRTSYEMLHWRIDSDLSVMGSNNDTGEGNHAMWSWTLGTAYIFGEGNIAPYLEGGMGLGAQILSTSEDDAEAWEHDDTVGVGALFYVGGGVEMFRFYETRLLFGARVVLPAYKLKNDLDPNKGKWAPSIRLTTTFVW